MGQLPEAIACYHRALELGPDNPQIHLRLGHASREFGDLDAAIAHYRRALEGDPDCAEAHHYLGHAFRSRGKLNEALACYRAVVDLMPNSAPAHANLALALSDLGRLEEAAECYGRAIALDPKLADAYANLGNILKAQGKLSDAIAVYRRAVEIEPDNPQILCNLAAAYRDQGRLDEALSAYHRVLELNPGLVEAHGNLGIALKDCGRLNEAIVSYRRALELNPHYADGYSNLGNALTQAGDLTEAVHCYQRCIELTPGNAAAYANLGTALKDQGRLQEAIASLRKALELKPDYARAHSNLLMTMQYCPGMDAAKLAEAHAEFDRMHAQPLHPSRPARNVARGRHGAIRVGLVSPDFGRHPVGYFLVRVLENMPRPGFELICYSDRRAKDDLTARIRACTTIWRDNFGMSDERLAQQIEDDGITILLDLAGHTAHNRLLTFARKPAPIQISWIGYEGTTGLSAMDYLIADRYLIPAGSEQYYWEQVLRMPDGYVCYEPPQAAPDVAPMPAHKNGFTTFGSFNNLAKLTPEVIACWAAILLRSSRSRLVLKYHGLGDASVRQSLLSRFSEHGVEEGRVELLPATSYADYLSAYRDIDLILDPFPFSGGTTTCEALWMGVPVITSPQATFASRHSLSHLSNIGLQDTVADSIEEYVALAVSLADDWAKLDSLRHGLRDRMAQSPLCDGKRFAGNLAAILRQLVSG